MKTLVLFDIDGTLVLTGRAGVRALDRALADVFGRDGLLDGVAVAGRTDRAIRHQMAAQGDEMHGARRLGTSADGFAAGRTGVRRRARAWVAAGLGLLLLVTLVPAAVGATATYSISGTVRDNAGAPLESIRVYACVKNDGMGPWCPNVATESDGRWSVGDLPADTY
ncbi:MAG: hypothetical protein WCQ64_09255, partial [Acidobacteriota bacterium]